MACTRPRHTSITTAVVLDLPRKIRVTVTVKGDEMWMDWTGSSEVAAGPVDHPFVETKALCHTILKSLTMPLDALNEGHLRPLVVTAPPEHDRQPAVPGAVQLVRLHQAEMAMHLVVRALSQAIPERCPACSYQMFGPFFPNRPALRQALHLH